MILFGAVPLRRDFLLGCDIHNDLRYVKNLVTCSVFLLVFIWELTGEITCCSSPFYPSVFANLLISVNISWCLFSAQRSCFRCSCVQVQVGPLALLLADVHFQSQFWSYRLSWQPDTFGWWYIYIFLSDLSFLPFFFYLGHQLIREFTAETLKLMVL